MPDVLLNHTPDGGEIKVVNGQVAMDPSVLSAVYLSLFGGNEDDSGLDGDVDKEWWGNKTETVEARKYRSRTQYALHALPVASGSLGRLEEAVVADLTWMTTDGLASSITVVADITGPDRVNLRIALELDAGTVNLEVAADWLAEAA